MEASSRWRVTSSVGGRFPGVDPVFFKDRSRVAVATALAIKIYQLNTKQVVAKIPIDGFDISQLYLTSDESTFYVVRGNGNVDRIGVLENSSVRLSFSRKIAHIISDSESQITAVVQAPEGLGIAVLGSDNEYDEIHFEKHADVFALSHNREHAAFAYRRAKDTIISCVNVPARVVTKVNRDRRTHSIAISNKGLLAVGAPTGVIDVYYSKGIRTLKWHLERVQALFFSSNDDYLLSGGKERVLVFWQLATDRQQFLPRLDGDITSICSNTGNTLYGVTLANKQLLILSAIELTSRLQVAGTKAYMAKNPERERRKRKKAKAAEGMLASDFTTQFTIHPGTRSVYMFSDMQTDEDSTGPGCQVQIYNPSRDEQEGVFSVAPTIQPGKVRKEQKLPDPDTTCLEFTHDGKYMITIDVTPPMPVDNLMSRHDLKVNLRFWKQDPETNKWVVTTRVSSPHGAGKRVLTVCPSASSSSVLTASEDGGVRMWRPDESTGTWSVRKILPAFNLKSKAVQLAWSRDSSVIALGFETSVYLIDAQRFKVHQVVPNILASRVRGLAFMGNYLAALSKTSLVIWDIVAHHQLWSLGLEMAMNGNRLMTVDPQTNEMALAVNYWTNEYSLQSKVLIFDAASPVPKAIIDNATAISAIRHVRGTSSYYFISTRGVISILAGAVAPESANKPDLQSTLSTLYVESKADYDDMVLDEQVDKVLNFNSFDKVFDGDSTNLDALFDKVMTLIAS